MLNSEDPVSNRAYRFEAAIPRDGARAGPVRWRRGVPGKTGVLRWILVMLVAGLPLFGRGAELSVEVNRSTIYIGESVILSVKVSGEDPVGAQPDLSRLTGCTAKLLDSQGYHQVMIVNSRMDRFVGRTYTYEVTPSAEGRFQAGPVTLVVDGRTLSANGPSVQVVGVEKQDRVVIRVTASKESVLIDEPFDVTLRVLVQRMAGPYAGYDPLDPGAPPKLNVPYLTTGGPPGGLEGPDGNAILGGRLIGDNNAVGFQMNDFTVRRDPFQSMFGFGDFMQPVPAKIRLDRATVSTNGVSYYEYSLTVRYTPREENSHTFGPVVFKGRVLTGADGQGRGVGREVFAVGPAVTVLCVPPPEKGRPDCFIGAVGSNMTVTAALDSQTCRVGDPLRLTLTVAGNVSRTNIKPPLLSKQSALTRDFKVYDDTVRMNQRDGGVEFVYTLRPTRAGTLELPALELGYYDVTRDAYSTVRTGPLPVRANEAMEATQTLIVGGDTNRIVIAAGRDVDECVVAPLDMRAEGAVSVSVLGNPLRFWLLLLAPLAYGVVVAGKACVDYLRRKAIERRVHGAAGRAVAAAGRCSRGGSDPRAALSAVLRDYVSARFGVAARGLTPVDGRAVLVGAGVDGESVERLCGLWQRLFNDSYAPVAGDGDAAALCREVEAAVRAVDLAAKQVAARGESPDGAAERPGSRGVGRVGLLLVLLSGAWAGPVSGSDADACRFRWNEANARMGRARAAEDFLGAAEAYQRMVDDGVRNGPLFYNLGLALLKGEQPAYAYEAFLRSERYTGSNEETSRNLRLALRGMGGGSDTGALPWQRFFFFWHYQLPCSVRATLALCAFCAVWLALILRHLGFREFGGGLLGTALVLLMLLGSSVATTVHQERTARTGAWRLGAGAQAGDKAGSDSGRDGAGQSGGIAKPVRAGSPNGAVTKP